MPDFEWSESEREYYLNGEPVEKSKLKKWILLAVAAASLRMKTISQSYVDGTINHAEWLLEMQDEIRRGSRAMAQLAYGGNLDQKALGTLGAAVKEQFKYLSGFALDIENGDVMLGSGIVARSALYAEGLWARYQNFIRVREKAAGMEMERLVLGDANHCSECPEDAALGWVPIGTLAPLGARECLANCHCELEYRNEAKAFNGLRLIA